MDLNRSPLSLFVPLGNAVDKDVLRCPWEQPTMKIYLDSRTQKEGLDFFYWITLKETASMSAAVMIKGKHIPLFFH